MNSSLIAQINQMWEYAYKNFGGLWNAVTHEFVLYEGTPMQFEINAFEFIFSGFMTIWITRLIVKAIMNIIGVAN